MRDISDIDTPAEITERDEGWKDFRIKGMRDIFLNRNSGMLLSGIFSLCGEKKRV